MLAQVADQAGDVVGDEPPDGAAGVHADHDVTRGVEHGAGGLQVDGVGVDEGAGVTVNVYRPGGVDTAMQAWIRGQDPDRIGAALHTRFNRSFTKGALITPERSAATLIAHLGGDDSGSVWDVSDASARV